MAAFLCSGESASTELARADASRGTQLACQEALTQDRGSMVERVSGEQRVLRVLVVDDEREAAVKLVSLVHRCGHAASSAYDGATGLRVAASQHPDVVLLDLEMPFMDGCEVARQLRLDFLRTECFIIGVTEWADERCRLQAAEAGVDLVLLKPVEPSLMETLLIVECRRVNRQRTDNCHAKEDAVGVRL